MKLLMQSFLSILLTLFFIFFAIKTNATVQYSDILIEGKDTVELSSDPLEQYFIIKGSRSINKYNIKATSTACYKGYLATWEIKNDSLYLINVIKGCGEYSRNYFNLKKEFGSDRVYAKWFSGTIISQRGNLLFYSGFAPIHENEKFYEVKNGIIISTRDKNYLDYDKNLLYPSEKFLSDTLKKIVLKSLDPISIKKFSDSDACALNVVFNKEGEIEEIKNFYINDGISYLEESILNTAKTVLKNLPKLMKVTHEKYRPPKILLHFDAHCLKYPWDKEYGCDY